MLFYHARRINSVERTFQLCFRKVKLVVAGCRFHAILSDLLRVLCTGDVYVLRPFAGLHEDYGLFLRYLDDTAGGRRAPEFTVDHDAHLSHAKRGTVRLMSVEDTSVADGGADEDLFCFAGKESRFGRADLSRKRRDQCNFLSSADMIYVMRTQFSRTASSINFISPS